MSLIVLPRQLVVDINGTPRVGAKLRVYDAGTSTPRVTYPTAADAAAETNPQTQPITSNSSGQFASIFVVEDDGPIKIAITDADDNALPGYPVDNIPVLSFDQNSLGRTLYPRTPNEIATGFTPDDDDFVYEPLPIIDIRRHGFRESRTEAQNAASIAEAVLVLQDTTMFGGIIQLPPGRFDCDSFVIPDSVIVQGCGRGTRLRNGDSGFFVKVGGDKTGGTKNNCGLRDLSILLTHVDGMAIRLMETIGGVVSGIYSESPINAVRTSRFLTIDGGDASSFFNDISNCSARHYHEGFVMTTTGAVVATNTRFDNCDAFGDAGTDPTSVGLYIQADCGQGSTFHGGNLEQCLGARFSGGHVSMFGTRFECPTTDIQFDALTSQQSFYGLMGVNPSQIVDNSGAGFQRHRFYGCVTSNGLTFGDRVTGNSDFRAEVPADIPITVRGATAQTGRLLQLLNSVGNDMYVVGPAGTMLMQKYRQGAGTPIGSVVPLFVGEEYFNTAGPAWFKATGDSANTQWVALN